MYFDNPNSHRFIYSTKHNNKKSKYVMYFVNQKKIETFPYQNQTRQKKFASTAGKIKRGKREREREKN